MTRRQIEIPRHAMDAHAAMQETPQDIALHSAIVRDDRGSLLAPAAWLVRRHAVDADVGDEIALVRIIHAFHDCSRVTPLFLFDRSEHHSVLPEFLRERTRVDAGDPRNAVLLHPILQGALRVPMTERIADIRHDDRAHVDVLAFEVFAETELVERFLGHAVIADERIREDQNLSDVTGIRHRFRIPDHARVENDLAVGIAFRTKRPTRESRAVSQDKFCHVRGSITNAARKS